MLNLLPVGASYGVLVVVFQRHWAEGLPGFRSGVASISWLPLFLFVVLFRTNIDRTNPNMSKIARLSCAATWAVGVLPIPESDLITGGSAAAGLEH